MKALLIGLIVLNVGAVIFNLFMGAYMVAGGFACLAVMWGTALYKECNGGLE